VKYYVFIMGLFFSFSLHAKEYDWTPVFKGWELGCDIGYIMDIGSNSKLEYNKYVEKPKEKKDVQHFEGGRTIYVEKTYKVKQGVYYSMPIVEIIEGYYDESEGGKFSFIINLPLKSVKAILKARNVKFKSIYSEYADEMRHAVITPAENDKQKTEVSCSF